MDIRFSRGDRIRFSAQGLAALDRGLRKTMAMPEWRGTVSGHRKSVRVFWDHIKTPSSYHVDFIELDEVATERGQRADLDGMASAPTQNSTLVR